MLHLNRLDSIQKRSIQGDRYLFLKDPDMSGFHRFFSADPSFPCSIATMSSAISLFNYWDVENKEVEFIGGDFVSRHDISRWVGDGGLWGNLASSLLSGEHDVAWYLDQKEKYRARSIGSRRYKIHRKMVQVGSIEAADCIVHEGGIMAAIVGRDSGLWCIGVEGSREQALKTFARSFQFLPSQFFSDLQRLMVAP